MSRDKKNIPDKMYFRIGETAELLNVKPYVLRYWETEFPDIKPVKSQSNQRLYKRRDVEMLMMIKHLLYEEKFTINGARDHLKKQMRSAKQEEPAQAGETDLLFRDVAEDAPVRKQAAGAQDDGKLKKVLAKVKSDLQWCIAELQK